MPNSALGIKVTKGDKDNLVKVSADLPTSKDWRESGGVSKVKNQGLCGACWAFTTTAVYESFLMIKGEQEYDLSEQYILECTSPFVLNVLGKQEASKFFSCAEGGNPYFSNKLTVINGIPLQSKYPFVAGDYNETTKTHTKIPGICKANETYLYAKDPTAIRAMDFTELTNQQMKNILVKSPVAALIYAEDEFSLYKSGVYSCKTTNQESRTKINHAVLIIGYDADGNYIIKNSWTDKWGDKGFGVVNKDFDCGLTAGALYFQSEVPAGSGLVYTKQISLESSSSSNTKSGVKTGVLMALMVVLLALFY